MEDVDITQYETAIKRDGIVISDNYLNKIHENCLKSGSQKV